MWNLFRRTTKPATGFCDRCGRVREERCRRVLLQELWLGIRI